MLWYLATGVEDVFHDSDTGRTVMEGSPAIAKTILPMDISDEAVEGIASTIRYTGALRIPWEQLEEYCPNAGELLPLGLIPGMVNSGRRSGTRGRQARGIQVVRIERVS
jgi:hypothetical protein